LYPFLKTQLNATPLVESVPELFVGTDPLTVYQYGRDLYVKRRHNKQDDQDDQAKPPNYSEPIVSTQAPCPPRCGCRTCV
jgi:hypothetical protein